MSDVNQISLARGWIIKLIETVKKIDWNSSFASEKISVDVFAPTNILVIQVFRGNVQGSKTILTNEFMFTKCAIYRTCSAKNCLL